MKLIFIAIFLLALPFYRCRNEFQKFNRTENEKSLIIDWLNKKTNLFDHFNVTGMTLKNIIQSEENFISNTQYNEQRDENHPCEQRTSMMLKHLLDGTPLPPEYTDFYKFVIYSGTGLNDLGDYSSCKKLDIMKYFTIQISVPVGPLNITLVTGICYFKECDLEYMKNAKADILSFISNNTGKKINDDEVSIFEPDVLNDDYRHRMLLGFLISAAIIGILVILPILQFILKSIPSKRASIIFDTFKERKSKNSLLENMNHVKSQEKEKSKMESCLEIFDISNNVSKLFDVKYINASHDALKVFDGVRCLSTFWVVVGHSFYFPQFTGFKNLTYLGEFVKTLKMCLIISGSYAVDVFFFLSGFMLCLSLNRYLNQKINKCKIITLAIVNRYLRLLPLYLFTIIFMTYLTPYLGGGPTYYGCERVNSVCPKYWWHNLLYINNLVKYENGLPCSGHTWYLANDMQFFVMGLIITIIFNKMSLVRNIIFGTIFIASNGYQIYDIFQNHYRFNDLTHPSTGQQEFFDGYYTKPWNRVCPYILGIFFCELFMKTQVHSSCRKELPNSVVKVSGWMEILNAFLMSSNLACAIIFFFSLILINYGVFITYFTNNYDIPQIWHALFLTFNKVIFVFGLACITHLTFLGKLGFIKDFLSLTFFSIIAKFTFGIYLIHYHVYNILFFSFSYLLYFNFSDLIFISIGVTVISFVCSFILTILLDSPVVNATKMLLIEGRGKSKE